MAMDDDSSVYVGGLAYDSTEDMLQKAFEAFGEINSIKIVYDRESGQSRGFGFVTFTSPRAASKAIHGLDGGIIGGRTIRVNEVKKNSGKVLNREASFRRDRDRREGVGDRDRNRDRRNRNFSPPRSRRLSPMQGRSIRGRSPGVSPSAQNSGRSRSPARSPRNRSPTHRHVRADRARSNSLNSSSAGKIGARSPRASPSPRSSERSLRNMEESTHRTPTLSSRITKDKDLDIVKVREELDRAILNREELKDKINDLVNAVEEAKANVSTLQSKSQNLEESLASALATASHRQQQLRKLHKGILQVRDSSERLKNHEKELKALMTSTMMDLEGTEEDHERWQGTAGNGGHFDEGGNADGGPSTEKNRA